MRRVVIAGMIGNGLEWYDFALYGIFAPILGKLFFPTQDTGAQLIASYGVFAAGFLMRPLGGIFFGYLGDRFGRKFALIFSLLAMAVPTTCIGLLPTYASIGLAAPILLILVRMMQGLALAGQFSGSITFIVEHAPMGRRGAAGASTVMSLCAGMLLGSGIATLMAEILSPAAFESWGWRVPFLLGAAIAFVGFYIRGHTEESPHYKKAKDEGTLSQTPVRDTILNHKADLLRGIGIYMSVTVPFYILTVFMTGFLSKILGYSTREALIINTISMAILMVLVVPTAALTDRLGRRRVMMIMAGIYLAATYPLFSLMVHPGFACALVAQMLLIIMVAFYIGAAPTVFVELFPTAVRYTGMSISYNICAALFGGTAPSVCFWLIEKTGVKIMPAFYIMFCAVLSLIAFIGYHDRYKEELK